MLAAEWLHLVLYFSTEYNISKHKFDIWKIVFLRIQTQKYFEVWKSTNK